MPRSLYSQSDIASAIEIQQFHTYTYCRIHLSQFVLSQSAVLEQALAHLCAQIDTAQHKHLAIDYAAIQEYDSYLVVWLSALQRFCREHHITVDVQNMTTDMREFTALLGQAVLHSAQPSPEEPSWHRFIEALGNATLQVWTDVRFFIEFLGEFCLTLVRSVYAPRSIRWADFPVHVTKAGVSAVPIVSLVGFLIGVIVAYQGAMQLVQFGAEIYLADMVAIALARELAPLMTAIIVAGRSGAAFAAEIGTMKVAEELDALITMGFHPMRFLVLPRVAAVTCVIPILALFALLAGICGGLIIGTSTLELSMSGYLNETKYALTLAHLFSGLMKSIVFGAAIALIGCMRGFQVEGGADSVGHFTTSSVVSGIVVIILLDAVFTVIFQALDI
ncbi:MAG: ABC transporter permease [Bacteroidota bacterium]|nr:ABC transporter permease [Candidatus Kapabacteria bacterium]MDW8221149.1 ABC transporter permease [Bacteroidota bacterium]